MAHFNKNFAFFNVPFSDNWKNLQNVAFKNLRHLKILPDIFSYYYATLLNIDNIGKKTNQIITFSLQENYIVISQGG